VKHALALSTVYPSVADPLSGIPVARAMNALSRLGREFGGRQEDPPSADGWRVSVINPIGVAPLGLGLFREPAPSQDPVEGDEVRVIRSQYTHIVRMGAHRQASAIAKAALPIAERIHSESPVDLVAAQQFFPDAPAAAKIAAELGVPLSIKARGRDFTDWTGAGFAREQMLWAARQADGLLAASEDLKRRMAALGIDRRRIAVHYTGLDRDRFRPLDHTQLRAQLASALGFAMPETAPLLACVGALSARNGQDIAIASLAGIVGARLILVGEGEDERHLRTLAADLDMGDRVHFAGSLDHDVLPLVLSAADALVLPCVDKGLANVWIEAIACGAPVVTTDTGSAREVIVSETAGRLVARDPDDVAAGVNALLNDPPLQREVAAFANRYSWERHARELAAHFDRLIGKERPDAP